MKENIDRKSFKSDSNISSILKSHKVSDPNTTSSCVANWSTDGSKEILDRETIYDIQVNSLEVDCNVDENRAIPLLGEEEEEEEEEKKKEDTVLNYQRGGEEEEKDIEDLAINTEEINERKYSNDHSEDHLGNNDNKDGEEKSFESFKKTMAEAEWQPDRLDSNKSSHDCAYGENMKGTQFENNEDEPKASPLDNLPSEVSETIMALDGSVKSDSVRIPKKNTVNPGNTTFRSIIRSIFKQIFSKIFINTESETKKYIGVYFAQRNPNKSTHKRVLDLSLYEIFVMIIFVAIELEQDKKHAKGFNAKFKKKSYSNIKENNPELVSKVEEMIQKDVKDIKLTAMKKTKYFDILPEGCKVYLNSVKVKKGFHVENVRRESTTPCLLNLLQ